MPDEKKYLDEAGANRIAENVLAIAGDINNEIGILFIDALVAPSQFGGHQYCYVADATNINETMIGPYFVITSYDTVRTDDGLYTAQSGTATFIANSTENLKGFLVRFDGESFTVFQEIATLEDTDGRYLPLTGGSISNDLRILNGKSLIVSPYQTASSDNVSYHTTGRVYIDKEWERLMIECRANATTDTDGRVSYKGGFIRMTATDLQFGYHEANEYYGRVTETASSSYRVCKDGLYPYQSNVDLGSRSYKWRNLYVSGDIQASTFNQKRLEDLISSNPNLLINPDFKVNQRGKSEYGHDGSDRYTVDQWKLQANLTLTVHNDYVTVSRNDPTNNHHVAFRQELNIPDDTSVTLQACVKGNGSFTLLHNGFGSTAETQVQDTDGWVVVKRTGYGASEVGVLLHGTATSLDIKWIKLELGAVSTPFVPPDHLEEALKCGPLENAEQQIFYGDGVWANAPSNPNLLDNPDFKVNQRGKSEYTEIAYAVDRWRMFDSLSRIEVVNRGIKITTLTAAGTNSNVNALFQLLNHPVDIYNGKQFTLSLKAINITGPWYACIRFGKSFPSGDFVSVIYRKMSSGINHWTFTVPDQAASMRIGIIQYGPNGSTVGDTITVEWTKLELGSVATPFIPPNQATELVKCQRYFFRKAVSIPFKYGDFAADNVNGKYVAFVDSFPVSMRTTPTVTVQAVKLNDTTGQMSKWIDGSTMVGSEVRANGVTSQGFSSILISKPGTATEGMTCSIRYEASADL